eukprot:TRINITY_DN4372_c0_g4_i2.p1 TRINITY_DN4372_c0_g4~~TRINITY_DN4372_c0_g4_i2.p1  ORF type:complete len:265 (-),score=58.13 TRINITY_DN4372_c0_g4_i2:291-1085(-)
MSVAPKLLEEFNEVVRLVVHDSQQHSQFDQGSLNRLLFVFERVLKFGLKDIAIFGKTVIWDFLEKLPDCLPGTDTFISNIKRTSRNDIARGRLWIRFSFNSGSMHEHVESLLWNERLVKKFYSADSILLNDEHKSIFLMLLESLSMATLKFETNVAGLEHPNYYSTVSLKSIERNKPVEEPKEEKNEEKEANQDEKSKVVESNVEVVEPPVDEKHPKYFIVEDLRKYMMEFLQAKNRKYIYSASSFRKSLELLLRDGFINMDSF